LTGSPKTLQFKGFNCTEILKLRETWGTKIQMRRVKVTCPQHVVHLTCSPDNSPEWQVGAKNRYVNINEAGIEDLVTIVHIDHVIAEQVIRTRPHMYLDSMGIATDLTLSQIEDIYAEGVACV
jgi:hypothetical protein